MSNPLLMKISAYCKEKGYSIDAEAFVSHYESNSLRVGRNPMRDWKAAAEKARAFAQCMRLGEFKTLLLLGAASTGKTHLVCGIIRECGDGTYRLASEIVEEIRRAKSFSSRETETDILDFYGGVRFLVVDEIGRGSAVADEHYAFY